MRCDGKVVPDHDLTGIVLNVAPSVAPAVTASLRLQPVVREQVDSMRTASVAAVARRASSNEC